MASGRRRRKARARKGAMSRWRGRLALVLVTAAAVGLAWLIWPFWQLSEQFAQRTVRQPSRLYGDASHLVVGRSLDATSLIVDLERLGYSRVTREVPRWGEFTYGNQRLRVHLRDFPTAWGRNSGGPLEVLWQGSRVERLRWRGEEVEQITIEPPLLFAFYGAERQERRPIALETIPDRVIRAILAAEDDGFFEHSGLSPRSIVRAALANLRGGGIQQGGSTLTQQLAKNLFLSQERTWLRKMREAVLALLIDWRYEKEEILEAYLNEIYWGTSAGVNLMGIGAAAWAYFGTDPAHLDLCQSAVLAGMISSPGGYSPIGQPDRSLMRRDWVLGRMAKLGWIESEELTEAANRPLCVSPRPATSWLAPYFGDLAAAEAERRFGIRDLADSGFVLLSTLDRKDQETAEASVAWGLEALEKGWEKDGPAEGPLQAALVSINPQSGALRAYVGGREYRRSQFDRASQARRQAGSAFKPVVYTAAFESGTALPTTLIEDAPLTVEMAGRTWSPRNSDEQFRGWVTARAAVEQSLNVPTARLALDVGLPRIVELGQAMGIRSRLQPVPALALGAFELTPLELASVYAVLANGGIRTEIHGLRAVLDPRGQPVEGRALASPERVVSEVTAYLMTSILQGVLDRGTAASARVQGLTDPLAGKTGTTNDRRDSWFAGYSPDRVSLVWVGYDDNSPTRLSGSRAALPIWARFTYKVRPSAGYPVFRQPPGVTSAVVDPLTGRLATDDCQEVLTEVFPAGRAPYEICNLHGRWVDPDRTAQEPAPQPEKKRWRWLRKIFGDRDSARRPPG